MRRVRAVGAVACALALGCVVAPPAPLRSEERTTERVVVYYPAGECGAELELELYDRATGEWRPHPVHPRLAPGSCAFESPERLLNELRVRCADETGRRAPSEWVVGVELAAPAAACKGAPLP